MELSENAANVSYAPACPILFLTNWWDGTMWHLNDPFSTPTINRFRPAPEKEQFPPENGLRSVWNPLVAIPSAVHRTSP
jgi:hypothetical protein